MGGAFRFVDEQGIPLDMVVGWLHDNGMMMDWLDFVRASKEQGWPEERTIGRLREAVGDVYGSQWADEWLVRCRRALAALESP